MEVKFKIWSNQHRAWWLPAGNGYTENIEEAGTYTWAEAIDICRGANWNIDAAATGKIIPDEAIVPFA